MEKSFTVLLSNDLGTLGNCDFSSGKKMPMLSTFSELLTKHYVFLIVEQKL